MPFQTDPSKSVAILGDTACIYCGENLKGLSAQSKCPSCGKLAGYSMLGDHLRDVDSGWIRTIMHGINLISLGYLVLAVIGVLGLGVVAGPASVRVDLAVVHYCLLLAGWGILIAGVILVTKPETSGSLIARRRGVAITLRVSSVLCAALIFVPDAWLNKQPMTNVIAYYIVFGLSFVLSSSLVWVALRKIIDRTPRREVTHALTTTLWITVPIYVLASRGVVFFIGTRVSSDSAQIVRLAAIGLIILHRLAALYPLQLTGKAIRRTVGYWS
ncbi:hypothetical protein BH10PLA1_BH10PLA1_14380 [soil metagenome]